MRVTRFVLMAALLLSPCATAAHAFADAPSAGGSYQFTTGDRYLKYVKFEAQALEGGGATGNLFFSDETEVSYTDVDTIDAPSSATRPRSPTRTLTPSTPPWRRTRATTSRRRLTGCS